MVICWVYYYFLDLTNEPYLYKLSASQIQNSVIFILCWIFISILL